MAEDMGVPYLGDIELDPRLGQSCDSGRSFIGDFPDSRVSKSYQQIIHSELVQIYTYNNNYWLFVTILELKEKLSNTEVAVTT